MSAAIWGTNTASQRCASYNSLIAESGAKHARREEQDVTLIGSAAAMESARWVTDVRTGRENTLGLRMFSHSAAV